jgi:DNA polymerase III delta prime subunit
MKGLQDLSHHAYLLIGSAPLRLDLISILEKDHNILAQANPDFYDRSYENLTIDDARELKSLHSTRPIGVTGKKIFIITTNAATVEAQNALLKLLEEPAEYAHFFLIVPSGHILLPTVKSRMREIAQGGGVRGEGIGKHKSLEQKEIIEEAKKFLNMTPAKRLEVVKKLVEDITKEKKTKQDAINFLDAIQAVVYEEKGVKSARPSLEVIETSRKYIHDRAPSVKMLMEYVALNV